MNWSITASSVITSVLAHHQGESLIRLGEACALVEKASSDSTFALGSQYRTLVFNVAIELAPLLDADAIATAMLYQLPSLATAICRETLERVLSASTQNASSVLTHDLLRFSGLEWNTWPAVPSDYRSEKTQEMLRRSFLFAVGPVTEEERRSRLFLETASHNRETQVPNLVNLLSTISTDWRVPYIKIAERICLTRMLGKAEVREVIPVDAIAYARINLAVYAALAEQQGTWQLKSELEDASLALLDPAEYRAIEAAMSTQESREAEKLKRVIDAIQACLMDQGISHATVYGRRKHIYSIYRKMKSKGLSPDEMVDLLGVRIIVRPVPAPEETALEERVAEAAAAKAAADVELRANRGSPRSRSGVAQSKIGRAKEAAHRANRVYNQVMREMDGASKAAETAAEHTCYDAFAVLRAHWMPVRDVYGTYDMRDWIRYPKENGYQSIHAALLIDGMTVEVQIRTKRMHEQAEFGAAAYSIYKNEKNYGSLQPVAALSGL